ncbi:GrpB-like predicted nucleotidyltransferase (UPF0157 family) [Kribbella amoyensis]|uniref:GrpB-like predicted nucleotidyltransferase (UPF0157 family) n=1 Tax=Kribbella amoyensis TaxID=996641 RepID=A0A561BPF3_9ACTN|nr:GrpB family protein [Kribbella amoyensis]TWD80749.1 GrpB-like predicted nucleotidyltransferase (UPF0157 family) [Kribbella amoyensis]
MRLDRISIEAYDDRWPALFEEQRRLVEPVLRPWLARPVEHVGSTSVPGLPAKAIIDMAAIVRDHDAVAAAFDELAALDWVTAPEPGEREARKWSLCHPTVERRSHHLHVVEESSDGWRTWLAFRDHLRTTPADRDEYARIKRELAAADDQDRPAYRAGKAPFITGVLAKLER